MASKNLPSDNQPIDYSYLINEASFGFSIEELKKKYKDFIPLKGCKNKFPYVAHIPLNLLRKNEERKIPITANLTQAMEMFDKFLKEQGLVRNVDCKFATSFAHNVWWGRFKDPEIAMLWKLTFSE